MKRLLLSLILTIWCVAVQATTISESFTATGVGNSLSVHNQDSFTYSVSGTFSGTVILESSQNLLFWTPLLTFTGAASDTVLVAPKDGGSVNYRFRVSAYTSGTIVTSIADASSLIQSFNDKSGTPVVQITDAGLDVFGALTATSQAFTGTATFETIAATGSISTSDQFKAANGTAAAPAYSYSNDLDSGEYRIAANTIGTSVNGVLAFTVGTTGVTSAGSMTGTSFIPTGSTVPANGIYLSAANTLAFATNTTLAGTIDSAQTWIVGAVNSGATHELNGLRLRMNAPDTNTDIYEQYRQGGTAKSFIGVQGAAGGLITGTGQSSTIIRTQTFDFNVSTNSGSSSALLVAATSGDTTIGLGNLILGTVGKGFQVKEGSNAKQGTCTLVLGTCTVSNTSVTATSRIFLTSQSDGGTPGFVRISARTAATSFDITSSSVTDTSVIAYEIFEPTP